MKIKRWSRFLCCLLTVCLLLTVVPVTAESPATPTDLSPAETLQEMEPLQESGEAWASEAEDQQKISADEAQREAEEPQEASEALPGMEAQPEKAEPEAVETEKAEPFLASVSAAAWLFADRDCFRKQQMLAEPAVVLVASEYDASCEVLYAYTDIAGTSVPGRAYARRGDLHPLTEDEAAAWIGAEHPAAIERMGFRLEPVVFGLPSPQENVEAQDGGETEQEDGAEFGKIAGQASEEETGVEKALSDAAPATNTDLSYAADSGENDLNTAGVVPMEENLPAVRDQNPFGTCWAFSAIGAMEIFLRKQNPEANADIDLSELYLAYFVYHLFPDAKPGGEGDTVTDLSGTDDYLNVGGTNLLAVRVLENLIGTVEEKDAKYEDIPAPPTKYEPVAAQLTGAYIIDVGAGNRETVKKLILEHGAVGASVYMPDHDNVICNVSASYGASDGKVGYSSGTHALYGTTTRTNHDILLVGWDDDYSRTNFLSGLQPYGNGAWKARNSWGSGWGEGGYFWISYEDAALTGTQGTAYSAINGNTTGDNEVPDFCYSYNKIPDVDSYEESSAWVLKRPSPVSMSQTFTVDGQERILSVGVETGTPGVTLSAQLKVEGDTTVYSGSMRAVYKGFYRIKLDQPVTVNSRKKVTVTVTYTHGVEGTEVIIPYEPGDRSYTVGTYRYTTHSGSGGFILGGETIGNADSCIKLYTKKETGSGVTRVELKCADPALTQAEEIRLTGAIVGEAYQLTAVPSPAVGVDTTIRWTSTNPSVASVSQNGLVTILAGGKTEIVATAASGARGVCRVTAYVVLPQRLEMEGFSGKNDFTITNANAAGLTLGDTLSIWARLTPENSSNPEVVWETSDSSVLQITGNGWEKDREYHRCCDVRVRGNGRAVISARSVANPEVRASVTLTIDLATGITLDRTECELTEGDGLQLNAAVQPGNVSNRNMSWKSSDTRVVTVDGSGRLMAVKPGKATITVTSAAGGFTASCAVTVSPRDPIEAFVYRMYRVCLQREPDAGGFRSWVEVLRSGQATGAQLAYGFYNSPEMINRRLSNADYVALAYVGIMNREADAGGKANWTEVLDSGMSYSSVIAGFTNSVEFTNLCASYGIVRGDYHSGEPRDQNQGITGYVTRLYTKMLGRNYDADGLNSWCRVILEKPTKETLLSVALNGFMHSPEFLAKGLSDVDFVKVLYRTFLGREYEEAGLRSWVAALQSGSSRDQVAAGFAYSPEFSAIMAQFGF